MWCWKRFLRFPWTARRSNRSILKEICPKYSLEGLMLKLKLQYFGHLMQRIDSFKKDPDARKDWSQEEKRTTGDEMVGWYYWLDGHEFEQAPAIGDGQGSLVCCSPWSHKESDTTEQLNWTVLKESTQTIDEASSPSSKIYFRRRWLNWQKIDQCDFLKKNIRCHNCNCISFLLFL